MINCHCGFLGINLWETVLYNQELSSTINLTYLVSKHVQLGFVVGFFCLFVSLI